jgi:hypothetical protein
MEEIFCFLFQRYNDSIILMFIFARREYYLLFIIIYSHLVQKYYYINIYITFGTKILLHKYINNIKKNLYSGNIT